MKKHLGAGRILANIQTLKGFTTKRQLAEFFKVGPSAVTDWTNRKGDRIPARRLADISRLHGLRWDWLAYGEGHPFDPPTVDNATGVDLDSADVALLARVKNSPHFRRAVDRLLDLPEEQVRMIAQLAEALRRDGSHLGDEGSAKRLTTGTTGGGSAMEDEIPRPPQPFLKYSSRYPLTSIK